MINWIASLPNFSAYGTPMYFFYLILAILPLASACISVKDSAGMRP